MMYNAATLKYLHFLPANGDEQNRPENLKLRCIPFRG